MLRRVALLLCLAAPVAALAQTTSSVILTFKDSSGNTLTSNTLGRIRCDGSAPGFNDPTLSISWTLVPQTVTNPVYGDNDTYRISATTSGSCPSDDTTGKIDIISANKSDSGSYPVTGTLLLSKVLTTLSVTCGPTSVTDQTIRICVALKRGTGGTTDGNVIFNTFDLQLAPPPAPTGLSIQPGEGALNISWSAGTVGTGQVTTARYRVSVTPQDTVLDRGGTRTSETSARSYRQGGLVNGVKYTVAVVALSAGGNASLTGLSGEETPQPVADFFDMCSADPTCPEKGGCAGGPAGLLSLLGLAAALRLARRRS